MFGIALNIKLSDFDYVLKRPRSTIIGCFSQFVLLPAFTLGLIIILEPHPGLALGMILVAACPGGNISNLISSFSGANVPLSVGLTAIATLLTPVFTPLNFDIWAHIIPEIGALASAFEISFLEILKTIILLIVLPVLVGMWVNRKYHTVASRIERPVRILSVLILFGFIVIALKNNYDAFRNHLSIVFLLVLIHNAMAFALGYGLAILTKLPEADRRTLAIETGIQNSGLGLIIIFTFFDGNGAMAIVAAWWGIWHIIAGLSLSAIFQLRDKARNLQRA